MSRNNLPDVGDVITSNKFTYGYQSPNDEAITVDGRTTSYPVTSLVSEDDRVAEAARTGAIPPKQVTADWGAYDPSRASARYVVEAAAMQGGGTGHGSGDIYPNGWHIKARRLNSDGSYNPNGELIQFYVNGPFTYVVKASDISVVGKLSRTIA